MKIALANKAAATEVGSKETTWEQICKNLNSVKVGPKDGSGWIAADIDSGPRRSDRVRSVSVLVLDVESKSGVCPPALETVQRSLEFFGYDAHVHTSYNHAPDRPRFRVVVRLEDPMPPDMLKQSLAALADKIGLADCWDRQCSDPARLFYLPRCPEGREHLFQAFTVEGRPLTLANLQQMIEQTDNTNVLPFPTLPADDKKLLPSFPETPENIERVRSQLAMISADCDRAKWRDTVWAVISTGWESAYSLASLWSQTAPDLFDKKEFDKVVASFKPDGGIGLGTLHHYAKAAGWTDDCLLVSGSKPRFTFKSLEELRSQPPLQWRVKGLLPKTGLAAIIGQSGSGKTFLALDLIASIALGEEFFGFKTDSCPVVYLGLEGSAGIGKRIRAYEQHYGLELPDNFRVVTDRISLLTSDAAEFAKAVAEAGLQGGVIVIDTMSQASPGADENSSVDMSRILANAQLLQQLTGSLIAVIHHLGKDAARGARGHSSLTAALDTVIEVKQTKAGRDWLVAKSKDGEDGLRRSFRLEQVQLGTDDDGDPVTSCVAVVDSSGLFAKPQLTGKNQGRVWAAISVNHSAGDELTKDELQKLAGDAITVTNNKGQRIKETIGALTEKGYLTLTDSEDYLIN
jgi:hypothetical protein